MLEHGILKHKEKLISTEKLLKIANEGERYTNPLAYTNNDLQHNDSGSK